MAMKYLKIFYDWYEMTQGLTDEEYGSLIRGLQRYARDGETAELKGIATTLFPVFKTFVDRESDAYDKKVKQCREAGSKGGKSKRTLTVANEISEEQEQEQEQDQEQDQDQEKEKENAAETANDISVFKAPGVEEVYSYCKERGNTVDAEAFIDYYSSIGWMVGKNPMRDWKAAVRSWEKRHVYTSSVTSAGKEEKGSFDEDDFFEAALKKSYGEAIQPSSSHAAVIPHR